MKQILEYKNIVIPLQRNRERLTTSRSGAVVARWAHNPKVVSSSLASATKKAFENNRKLFLYPCTLLVTIKHPLNSLAYLLLLYICIKNIYKYGLYRLLQHFRCR